MLRKHFNSIYTNPHRSQPQRFCWDYWHIPDEYTLLRTPAYQFFPPKIYEAFHRQLVRFGRERLGCHDVSPPWLSCYVDGCRQEEHQDVPHGPLAFVYSLTPWAERQFTGGETFLRGSKEKRIPAIFNRLTVFDPATPHGVRVVKGVHSVLEGRLVIHGWFVQPRPFFTGKLKTAQVNRVLDEQLPDILDHLPPEAQSPGFVSFRLNIAKSGKLTAIEPLVDTNGMGRLLKKGLSQLVFPRALAPSKLTLPIQFRA